MPAFIKGEGCLVNASDVQEIHHSGNFGGIVGVKTAVANNTDHGTVIARLVPEEDLGDKLKEMGRILDGQMDDADTAAKVAESFAGYLMNYAKSTQDFLIAFNAETQGWDVTYIE